MKAIRSTFAAENACWLAGAPKNEYYLYLELQGTQAPVDERRVPLNISLVIDRSGSMQGPKIDYVKKAAQFVIDNLSPSDHLSIIQYDDVIEVVSPSAPVQQKAELKRRVEALFARNMTNLSGGMLAGYDQVQATKQDKYVNRVLLLSDGLANRGITDPATLQQIAQTKFREQGIALSTFGVGADYNEVLMTNLSEYGGANYYFIDSPDKIPALFAEELRGLLAVVAQNVKVQVDFPPAYFTCEKVYGFPADTRPEKASVLFNDLFSEEKKAVLLKFKLTRPIDRDMEFRVTLSYDNAVGTFEHITEELTLTMALSHDEEQVRAGVNPLVVEQTALFVGNDLYEAAIRLADKLDFEGAGKLLDQVIMYLEKHFQTMPPNEELSRLYQEILRYRKQLEHMGDMSRTDYLMAQKMSRSASYMSRRKKP